MSLQQYKAAYDAGKQFVSEYTDSNGKFFIESLDSLIQSEAVFEDDLQAPTTSLADSGVLLRTQRRVRKILEILCESKQRALVSLEYSDRPLAEEAFFLLQVAFSHAYQQDYFALTARSEEWPIGN
jgi:hypothetical protein